MIGGNLSAYFEAEKTEKIQLLDGAKRQLCFARSQKERSDSAVEHNNFPSLLDAHAADEIAFDAQEKFRRAHREASRLRDEVAAIECDLGYDQSGYDDYDYDLCV